MQDRVQNVLVLGAGGFIGRALVESLAHSGHHVLAATRRPTTFRDERVVNRVSEFSCVGDFLPLLGEIDCVIHAASTSTPGSSAARPQLDGNLRSTLGLLEALQEFPASRLMYISSGGSLYGDAEKPMTEEAPLRPRSYHAAGKIAAEYFVRAWAHQYSGTAIILRPSNIYGPGQKPGFGFGVIPTALHCVLEGAPFMMLGDGRSIRDYLYIEDFIELCRAALSARLGEGVHLYNVASGTALELRSLLQRIDIVTGVPLRTVPRAARTVDVRTIMLDCTAARDAFDWAPHMDLDEGLRRTWSWIQNRE